MREGLRKIFTMRLKGSTFAALMVAQQLEAKRLGVWWKETTGVGKVVRRYVREGLIRDGFVWHAGTYTKSGHFEAPE